MYRKRQLGVKEGNAIEDIVAFEMRQKRGVATTADKLAHDKACQYLGIRRTTTNVVHPAFQAPKQSTATPVPPFNYMFGPVLPSHLYGPSKLIFGWMAAWMLGCVLLGGAIWLTYELMSSVAQGLASFAYP